MKTVSDRLIFAFDHLKLSGYRVQKIYNLSGGAVSNWRKNLCQPRTEFLDRFCADYGVSKVWLLTGHGEMMGDNPDYKVELVSMVDKIKRATGASNKELASVMGTYSTVISELKAGKTSPRPEWLSRLEDEYGYILNELDLKKEVYKLRQELEEIKKMLPGCK